MSLLTESYLRRKVATSSGYYTENTQREVAARFLANERRSASTTASYDIFLSHASEDAIIIKAVRDELVEAGFTVYVDWIDDPQLDRSHVNTGTAAQLRERMNSANASFSPLRARRENRSGCRGN